MADNYSPGREAVQVTASPNLQTEQARFDPNDSMNSLVRALGMASPEIANYKKMTDEKDQQAGTAFANSMTLEDLTKHVANGVILPSQSPVFQAAVQNTYGQNTMEKIKRDTLTAINTGEQRFATNEDLNKFLVDKRNAALTGATKYSVAGFDRNWGTLTNTLVSANSLVNDANAVAQATQTAIDSLGNITANAKGTDPKETAGLLMDAFTRLQDTGLIKNSPKAAREVLTAALSSLAESGEVAAVKEFLASTTPGGQSVSAMLGGQAARKFDHVAQAAMDVTERKRVDGESTPFKDLADTGTLVGDSLKKYRDWANNNRAYVSDDMERQVIHRQNNVQYQQMSENAKAEAKRASNQSLSSMQQATRSAIENGSLAGMGQPTVLSVSGEQVPFDVKGFASQYIPQIVAQKKLGFAEEASLWSANGVTNPQWQGIIGLAAGNISSVGMAYNGKELGKLNPQGEAAIKLFSQLEQINPGLANAHAGSNAEMLSDITSLMKVGGFPDPSTAATLVNQSMTSGISKDDVAMKKHQISVQVKDLLSPSFFSLSNNSVVGAVKHLFNVNNNEMLNLEGIAATVSRRALQLVQSGNISAEDAVMSSLKYVADPAVSTKINGTLYFNKDLPTVPAGRTQSEGLQLFIDSNLKTLAKEKGYSDSGAVRLNVGPDGNFRAWVGGVPLTGLDGTPLVYSKDAVEKDIQTKFDIQQQQTLVANNPALFKDSVMDKLKYSGGRMYTADTRDGVLFGNGNTYGKIRVDPNPSGLIYIDNKPVSLKEVFSPLNYKMLQEKGLTNSPLAAILDATIKNRNK